MRNFLVAIDRNSAHVALSKQGNTLAHVTEIHLARVNGKSLSSYLQVRLDPNAQVISRSCLYLLDLHSSMWLHFQAGSLLMVAKMSISISRLTSCLLKTPIERHLMTAHASPEVDSSLVRCGSWFMPLGWSHLPKLCGQNLGKVSPRGH